MASACFFASVMAVGQRGGEVLEGYGHLCRGLQLGMTFLQGLFWQG